MSQYEDVDLLPTGEEQNKNVAKPYFAPGGASAEDVGVLYQADYQHEADGSAIAARLHARALRDTGVPVLLKPFSAIVQTDKGTFEPLHVAGVSDAVRKEVGDMPSTSISALFPIIRHFVIHKPEQISRHLLRGALGHLDNPEVLLKGSRTVYQNSVIFSVWERDILGDAISRELKRVGDNWVPCKHNADLLRRSGVEHVAVIPHPFDPASPLCHLTKRKPKASPRFYWIGRWEPRKNPVKLLEAFFAAFKPGDDAHLTMKYHGNWEGYPTAKQTLAHIQEEHPHWTDAAIEEHLTLIGHQLRADQIMKLHFENNIYVAASSGEAWCLPAFDAKVSGNRVIHTPWGGTADFCDKKDREIHYELGPVPDSYGWTPGTKWAEVDQQDLTNILRSTLPPKSHDRDPSFDEKFSLAAVGKLMRERLAERFGDSLNGGYLK